MTRGALAITVMWPREVTSHYTKNRHGDLLDLDVERVAASDTRRTDMKGTHGLWLVAMLAFTFTACGEEPGGGVTPTFDAGDDTTDAAPDVTDQPDVGPDATEDVGEDATEDVGEDTGPAPIDLTGTWVVTRDSDAVEVATLSLEQDEQFVEGTAMMGEEYGSAMGVLGTVLIDETDRTVSITWVVDDTENHRLLEADFSDEMATQYSSPNGFNIEVTVTREGQ